MKETKSKKKNKQQKGVSLIVLVITIIIMIILAATVIISLSNSGIIGKANEAVEQTNLKQVQTISQTLWAEGKLEGYSPETIRGNIIAAIGGESVAAKYDINVTETGVTVEIATNSGEDNGTDDDDNGEDNEGNEGNQGNEGGNDNNTNEGNTGGLPIIWLAGTDTTGLVPATDSEGNVIGYKISDYAEPIESLEGKTIEMLFQGQVHSGELTTIGDEATLKIIEEYLYDIGDMLICCTKEGTYDNGIFSETGVYITSGTVASVAGTMSFAIGGSIPNSVIITDTSIIWDGDTRGLQYVEIINNSGVSNYYYKVSDEIPSTKLSDYTKIVCFSSGEIGELDISDEALQGQDELAISFLKAESADEKALLFILGAAYVVLEDGGDIPLTQGVWFAFGNSVGTLSLHFDNIQE